MVDPAGVGVLDADVGVRDGRIAAVAPALEHVGAAIADAAGLLVVPGLVDLHTHVVPRFTYWGVDPDPLAARSGVTTWVDAGSAGAYGIDGLRHDVAARCTARVRAFLNISSIGLAAPSFELANRAYLDEGLCAEMAATRARRGGARLSPLVDRFLGGGTTLHRLPRSGFHGDSGGARVANVNRGGTMKGVALAVGVAAAFSWIGVASASAAWDTPVARNATASAPSSSRPP